MHWGVAAFPLLPLPLLSLPLLPLPLLAFPLLAFPLLTFPLLTLPTVLRRWWGATGRSTASIVLCTSAVCWAVEAVG